MVATKDDKEMREEELVSLDKAKFDISANIFLSFSKGTTST